MKVHRSTKPLVMLLVLLLFAVGIATPYVYAAEEQERDVYKRQGRSD